MSMNIDIRWEQRFSNFEKALGQLTKFLEKGDLNEFEVQGLIKSFEYTYELAWKTLQDFLQHTGYKDVVGPKPVIQQSFQSGFIEDGDEWIKMHEARNLTSHSYNEETAIEIAEGIKHKYYNLLKQLHKRLEGEKEKK